MIRLNTPIESIVINLQSAGEVNYNIQYVFVRNGVTLNKSVEGILTTSGQHVVLINDYSSGYFDITYLNITNIDPAQNYISVLKKTNVNETNLTSEAIGLKNRECIEFTSDSGFKTLDQNGSFKTITSSVSADGDVENSDMSYMATVPSGGSLTLPDSDIEVNGVPEGVVVSVKTISVDLNDGVNPVSPTLVTLVGNLLTITLPDIGDVTVENSDATYSVVEPSGGTLVLPDSQINVNGVDEGDVVSVKAINVDLTDGVNPVVPTSVGLVGNTLTITLPASGGGDVDIEINGVPYDTITAPATVDIPVINTTPVPVGTIVGTDVVVGDSTVNVRKSDATLISAVTVVAEGVTSYSVGDSTAVIKDSVGTTLKSEGILAATSEDITINNSTVNIRDTAANLLHSVSVRAEATTTQDIADTTVDNSDASYSVNVLAEGSLTLPDQQINVNSVDEGDIPSVGTIDIDLSDGVNPVAPTSVTITGRTIDIVVPSGGGTYDIDTTDRFGNVLPTIIVSGNTTLNWNSYDYADLFLSREASWGGSTIENALIDLVDDLIAAGLWNKIINLHPHIGTTADNHKWNLKYPFNNRSSFAEIYNGTTHDADGVYLSTGDTKTNFMNPLLNADVNSFTYGFFQTSDFDSNAATTNNTAMDNTFSSRGCQLAIRPSDGRIVWGINENAALGTYTPASQPTYIGRHTAMSRTAASGAGSQNLYIDGVSVATRTSASIQFGTGLLYGTELWCKVGIAIQVSGMAVLLAKMGSEYSASGLNSTEMADLHTALSTFESIVR